jgi:hypothetical protein
MLSGCVVIRRTSCGPEDRGVDKGMKELTKPEGVARARLLPPFVVAAGAQAVIIAIVRGASGPRARMKVTRPSRA